MAWTGLLAAAAPAQGAEHPLLPGCPEPLTPECADRLEGQALQTHAPLARRESGALRLVPPQAASTPPGVRWLGPLADSGLQLLAEFPAGQPPVFRLAGEGAPPLALPGPAWPAPGGRLLISVGPLAGGSAAVVLIGRVETRWRVLLRQEAAAGAQLTFVGWRSDAAAARLQWSCRGSPALAVQLRDGPFGWDWFPALPAGCPTQR
ncbi:MAG: hypothetical protein J0M20_13795 [Burkholderiales bacterium]|nr:hypothetical protein [Burkholderiales bacterium]